MNYLFFIIIILLTVNITRIIKEINRLTKIFKILFLHFILKNNNNNLVKIN